MTSIEQVLYEHFTALCLEFEMHVSMFGRWQPDFVFPDAKMIVQADGDYWHSKASVQIRDKAFDDAASQHGWLVLRFKGSVIKMQHSMCALDVLQSLEQQRLLLLNSPA